MLNTLVIMEGVNPIDMGGNTFGGNPLTSVYIGRTMTNVTSPFKGRTSLSKVTLGRGMTSLQSGAFAGCTGIKELVIEGDESAITIDCKFNDSPIEKLHIGRNGTYAFNNRVDLKEVSVGDNVTSLPNDAFNVYSVADGWKEFFTIQDVNGNVGVEDIVINGEDGSEPTIMVENGEIVVNGDEDARIAVYSINGGLIYQGVNRPVAVANKGVYVVIVNGVAVKVML